MKNLLLLFATIITLTAKSQTSVYHPFPEDTATWVTDMVYSACGGYCSTNFYEMKGDTLIKIGAANLGTDSFSACSYIGAIRQDSINKKVYFIDSTMTSDTLLYDFDLTVGDTIQSWYNKWSMPFPIIVSGIDSIFINGNFHKRFSFQCCSGFQITGILIEGIGWTGELFGVHLIGSGLSLLLACFNENSMGGIFTGECSASLNCDISVNINVNNEQKYFTLFPNLFSNKLNFTFNNNELSEIIIYDVASRKLLQQKFTNSVSLNTEQLAKGVYIYEVKDKNCLCKKGKVVKE